MPWRVWKAVLIETALVIVIVAICAPGAAWMIMRLAGVAQ